MTSAASWRSILALAVALPSLAGQVPARQVPARQAGEATSARDSVAGWPLREGLGGLRAALDELVVQHPDLIELVEIGESARGRPLTVGVLGPRRDAGESPRPGILVCPALDGDPAIGAQRTLELCERLLGASEGGELHPVLARATLYVLFVARPDALAGDASPAGSADLEHSFPVGWVPWSAEGRSPGPYPLSTPESDALARFTIEHESLALSVVLGGAGLALPAFVELGASHEDLATLEALLAIDPGTGAARSDRRARTPRPGGFAEFCFARAGVFPLATEASDPGLPAAGGTDQEALDALEVFFEDLVARLPRLGTSEPRLERLAPALWLLELDVQNRGSMPSASEPCVRQHACAPIELELLGGELLGAAVQADPSGGFEAAINTGNRVALGRLAADESRSLRLVVRAESEASLSIRLGAPRSGRVQLPLTLP